MCFLLPLSPISAASDDNPPTNIEADSLSSDSTHIRATGKVRADVGEYGVCADELTYNRQTGILRAIGSFQLKHDNRVVHGDSAKYQTNEQTGEVENFNIVFDNYPLRLRGDKLTLNPNHLSAANTHTTSCKPENEIWSLVAKHTDVDEKEKIITATDARFNFLGVPVMYLPFARWYYGEKRRSGFLSPNLRFSSSSGISGKVPYYFNLADNYDWTLSGDLQSKHGLEIENELRFLTPHTYGKINVNGVWFEGKSRGRQSIDYLYENGKWRAHLLAENVSDKKYLRDFGENTQEKSTRNLPRTGILEYTDGNWHGQAAITFYQTLQNDESDAPHRLLPALSLENTEYYDSSSWKNTWRYDNFVHNDSAKIEGERFVWDGDIWHYRQIKNLSITPNIGIRTVKYRTDDADDVAFLAPHAQLDLQNNTAVNADNFGDSFFGHYRLRAAYVYAPAAKNQQKAPLYDTSVKQQSFEDIYTWNRYAGSDRAADANFIAYGMGYHLYDSTADREAFFAGIGQRYHLKKAAISIPGETPIQRGGGNIFLSGRLQTDIYRTDLVAEWDTNNDRMERFYIDLLANFDERRLLRLGLLLDDEETLSFGGAMPLGDFVEAALSVDYVLDDDRYTDSKFALQIRSECDCWRMSLKIEDFAVDTDDNDVNISIGMEFVGFGAIGSSHENFVDSLR